jgi:phosphotriesterase-related protein
MVFNSPFSILQFSIPPICAFEKVYFQQQINSCMNRMDRRTFLSASFGGLLVARQGFEKNIMTVNGPISPEQLGTTLIHEHFLVDFIGADKTGPGRWNREAVVKKVLPYMLEAKKAGVKTIFDCTPAFLGRDVILLQQLAAHSGLQLVTNTGYYGAVANKYLPAWTFTETASQLAQRWISEAKNGIDDTGVRPGFIKISVDAKEPLSELHQKLVLAAAITHLETGLTICSHTGPAAAAFQQLDILQKAGVHPGAFVWVHAQAEKNRSKQVQAARMGAWVSLDGMAWGDLDNYAASLLVLKKEGLLHRVLISHDAGWYKPDEPEASFQGYTAIFKELAPLLHQKGFTQKDITQLLVKNPAAAMQIRVRKI